VLGGCDGFAFSAKAPNAALDFARYITAQKVQTDMAGNGVAVLPTVNGADSAVDDPNLKAVAEALKSATYLQLYYDQFLPPAVGGVVNDATQQLFAGTASPEEVAQTIEDSAAQELAS
jgi:raffinose/stachyose/melibiose transport system substrate-binding protein